MVYVTHLYVLFIFLIYQSAQAQNQSQVSCPKNFQCASLENVSFPFSKSSQPECGLYTIDCDASPHPKIQLGEDFYYGLETKWDTNSFEVFDPRLQDLLATDSCDSFYRNLSFPSSPLISFRVIQDNLTMFRCDKSSQETIDHHFQGFLSYKKCERFDIYYRRQDGSWNSSPEGDIPNTCSQINLPISWRSRSRPNVTGVFDMLTANFSLQWRLSDECSQCYYRGGQCLTGSNDNPDCKEEIKAADNRKTKRLLVTVIPAISGAGIAICIACIIIWRCKKSRSNAFSTTSLIGDLEGGSKYFGVPVFSYSELVKVTNNFDSSRELGDGGYGTVYHGKLKDGREVAVKRLYEHNSKRMEHFKNEIEILTGLRHRNLVTLYGCTSRRSRELLLVYEYIPNGTVADHLHGDSAKDHSKATLTWPVRMNIAIETASALAYLHASDIIHRDVKTNNILLDNNFCVKVADFGLSRLFPNDVTHISTAPQGTPGYVDPDYHECYQLTNKSDVYSFGVVLIELISSMPAVDINRHRDEINLANLAMKKILKCAFEELIDLSLGYECDAEVRRMTTCVAELAFRCLQLDKDLRPAMDEVLEILNAIQSGDLNENGVSSAENAIHLMKSKPPPSPNSVNDRWVTSSCTTSTSG